jgi:hypothetical protein
MKIYIIFNILSHLPWKYSHPIGQSSIGSSFFHITSWFSADATAVRQYGRIEVVAAKIALDPHVTHRNALAGLGGIQQKFCNRGFNMTQPKKGICVILVKHMSMLWFKQKNMDWLNQQKLGIHGEPTKEGPNPVWIGQQPGSNFRGDLETILCALWLKRAFLSHESH